MPGQTSRTGYQFLYEPLYFYNAYGAADNIIPWIATGHEFNADYTEVTVAIRTGVTWSDGQPWTAHDFAFTINILKANAPLLLFSTDMETWVKEAVAVDSLTARIDLTARQSKVVEPLLGTDARRRGIGGGGGGGGAAFLLQAPASLACALRERHHAHAAAAGRGGGRLCGRLQLLLLLLLRWCLLFGVLTDGCFSHSTLVPPALHASTLPVAR